MSEQQLIDDIHARLASEFGFKVSGQHVRGRCPSCGEKEAWTSVAAPWVVFCGRANKCGETHTARALFGDLFEHFSARFPTTPDDPNATARAYLTQERRFDLAVIKDAWQQGYLPLKDGSLTPTVRFPLWGNAYWERVIDRSAMSLLPASCQGKTHFSAGARYRGKGWAVPGQVLEKGDQVLIVEGIFHAIALAMVGVKAIAAFSCQNFPSEWVAQYAHLKLTWVLAYDHDDAGIKAIKKWRQVLQEQGLKTKVMLTPNKHLDWDDCLRNQAFEQEKFWLDCEYRGHLAVAETAMDYAFHRYRRGRQNYMLFAFEHAYWVCYADEVQKALGETDIHSASGQRVFVQAANVKKVSNCLPQFLYQERDDVMGDKWYVFKVSYQNNHADELISLEGSNLESPSAFNKSLLNKAAGGVFNGSKAEMDILLDRWFKQIKTIHSMPYVGYNAEFSVYVYQSFAIHKGREIPLNGEGYFDLGSLGVKTSMKSPAIVYGEPFTGEWFADLQAAFGENGLVVLGFWTATLFVQQIRKQHKSFPFLEMTGEPGAGKSTLIETLWHLLGRDYEGFDPQKATKAGIRRAFNQVSNLPVVLIEGDHMAQVDHKQRGFTFDSIKPLYDGRGTGTLGIAKRGNDTDEPMFNGALVIAQNASVTGEEALMERIVHLFFRTAPLSTRAQAMRLRNASLKEMAGYLPHVLKQEQAYLAAFFAYTERYDAAFRAEEGVDQIKQRLIFNHAQVMASVAALGLFFPQLETALSQVYDLLLSRLRQRHQRLAGDSALLEQFWEIFHYIDEGVATADSRFVAEQATRLNHHRQPERYIAINLNDFYEQCRKHNQPLLELQELKRQLPSSRTYKFIERKKYRSALTEKVSNCWLFARQTSSAG
ncbi:toprim domain-containing protein [Marinomonas sp. THO17]|uniref:toprim domain-containing protein n=1 Tax=Marinomonas sp. THO17 TaxID=3149048 RepID=UPI00336BD722